VRAIGPGVSKLDANATHPQREHKPYVGFIPTSPVIADGKRIDPPVSVPVAAIASPPATLLVEPPDEPPAVNLFSICHGLTGAPKKDVFENVGDGVKKVLYGALVVLLSYTVLILVSSHPIGLTILHNKIYTLLNTNGLNILTYPLATLISALFNSDFAYYEYGVLNASFAAAAYTGSGVLPFAEFITQTMYGFAMYFAPTSVILLFTLSLLDIKYTTWLKKMWLYLLIILVVIILVYLGIYFNIIV
jgi:hypothetical protein